MEKFPKICDYSPSLSELLPQCISPGAHRSCRNSPTICLEIWLRYIACIEGREKFLAHAASDVQ